MLHVEVPIQLQQITFNTLVLSAVAHLCHKFKGSKDCITLGSYNPFIHLDLGGRGPEDACI